MRQTSPDAEPGDEIDWFGLPSPALVRAAGGLLAAALASALGAFVLGEYEFKGWLPPIAGVLFGLVVGEIAVSVGKRATAGVAVLCAAFAAAGLIGAGFISAGAGAVRRGVWLAAALGAIAAGVRVAGVRARRSRAPRTS